MAIGRIKDMLSRKSVCSALLIMANIILFVMTIIPKGSEAAIDADETLLIDQDYVHNEVGSSMTNFLYKNQLIEEQVFNTDRASGEVLREVIRQFEGKEEAYAYVITDEMFTHLSSKEEAEEVSRIVKGIKQTPSRGTGSFIWPADGGYISSEQGPSFGKMHKGIDIAQPTTKTIHAADHGTVVEAGVSGGYGNKIRINHNNGYETIYAHLELVDVKIGDTVKSGSKIGIMGSTGHSTGTHLHFEILKNGRLVDPLDFIVH